MVGGSVWFIFGSVSFWMVVDWVWVMFEIIEFGSGSEPESDSARVVLWVVLDDVIKLELRFVELFSNLISVSIWLVSFLFSAPMTKLEIPLLISVKYNSSNRFYLNNKKYIIVCFIYLCVFFIYLISFRWIEDWLGLAGSVNGSFRLDWWIFEII